MADAVLRLPEVIRRTGLRRSSIYNRITAGSFPRPVSLGGRSVGWLESEVEAQIHTWAASRDDEPAMRSRITPRQQLALKKAHAATRAKATTHTQLAEG